jgi:hypothetical protein
MPPLPTTHKKDPRSFQKQAVKMAEKEGKYTALACATWRVAFLLTLGL